MVGVVAFGDTAGKERQPEALNLVAVEVPHCVAQLLRRCPWPRDKTMSGERVEDPGVVSVDWAHFVALFRRVSASMRDTHSA